VALAVLAALSSVMVALADGGRKKAAEITCASNLRQIGVAMHVYANEHGGMLPESACEAPRERSWIFTLEPYLGAAFEQVRVSPGDPRADERLRHEATSYVLNHYTSVDDYDAYGRATGFRRMNTLPNPAVTPLTFIAAGRRGWDPTSDHTHAELWRFNWSQVVSDIAPSTFGDGEPSSRKGRANYLFADGRVESIDAADLHQAISRGRNFADPRQSVIFN